MDCTSTPGSHGYSIEYDYSNQLPMLEWNTLDKFLEWQHDQQDFSLSGSHISDHEYPHQMLHPQEEQMKSAPISDPEWNYFVPEKSKNASLPSNFEVPLSGRIIQWATMTSGSTSPSVVSPPHSMPDDYALYSDDFEGGMGTVKSNPVIEARESTGPQLPKIGRPRNTPTAGGSEGTNPSGKAPGQARRRSQNREAQRAFRARQRQYIEQLAIENKALTNKNKELEERCRMLASAYEKATGANTRRARMVNNVFQEGRDGAEEITQADGSVTITSAFGMPWTLAGQGMKMEDRTKR